MKNFIYIFLILISLSCSKNYHGRVISSTQEIDFDNQTDIIARAYRCLDKVEFLNTFELTFKNDDSEHIKNAFSTCLSEYIQIQTISPFGDEHKAVIFWATIFDHLKIPHKIYQTKSPIEGRGDRWNLVATIPATGEIEYDWSRDNGRKSIILTHHMDVVDVIKEQWLEPDLAFSGKIQEWKGREYIWGRGAYDMKGMGVAQFLSMLILKNKNPKALSHDIHFLALADEEEKGSGAVGTLKLMGPGKPLFALSRAKILLNEGGGALENIPVDGKNLIAVGVEEKGGAWLKVNRKDPIRLLKSLNKLGLLDIDRKKEKKNLIDQKIKCSIVKIIGPEPKVNVVTSKLALTLDCSREKNSEIARIVSEVVKKGFDEVKFNIEQDGNLIEININTDSSSHGSVGLSLSAIDVLATTLYRLRIFHMKRPREPNMFKHKRTEVTKIFIKKLEKYNKQLKIFNKFSFIPFVRKLILKEIEKEFNIDSLFKTNCMLTNFNYNAHNATSYIDCRLLHTTFSMTDRENHAQKFIKHLIQRKFLEFDLQVELISGWNFSKSSLESPYYLAMMDQLQKDDPDAIVTPYMNPAGSDNAWFRNPFILGINDVEPINSYGVFTATFTPELIGALHGSNERFPTDQATPTVEKLYNILVRLDQVK